MSILTPDYYFKSISEIDAYFLKQLNITALILDIDNTLVPYSLKTADETAKQFIDMMTQNNIKICFVSNNKKNRVDEFNKQFSFPAIHRSAKPLVFSYLRAVHMMHVKRKQTAVVGDQIFTDILGGNSSGITTILVDPIDSKNDKVKLKRKFEARILEKIKYTKI